MKYTKILQFIIRFGIIVGIILFFMKEFQKNWSIFQTFQLEPRPIFLILSLLMIISSYPLLSHVWHTIINTISHDQKILFIESFMITNLTGLTKYVPGKIWSYSLQMIWLGKKGFSRILVLYVNFLLIILTCLNSAIIGCVYLTFFTQTFPPVVSLGLILGLVILTSLTVMYNEAFVKIGIKIASIILKRELQYFVTPKKLIICMQCIIMLVMLLRGIGGYFISIGLGFDLEIHSIPSFIAAISLGETLGFLMFLAPAGLGIRESVMYIILDSVMTKDISLILPVAMRIATMMADILLGITGFILFKKITMKNLVYYDRTNYPNLS